MTFKSVQIQNAFIVLASYVFYGWWDWRFLALIVISTIVDYSIATNLNREQGQRKRKLLLWASVVVNIGLLGFFKYYNFFTESFASAFSFFGKTVSSGSLDIILPVGISFYTFQTLSYTIDVYNRKLEPTKNFVGFAAFVCFFPQLVAGPIERATNLLPQILKKRKFNYEQASSGLKLMVWGLFKKVAIADSLAPMVDDIFANTGTYPSSTLLLGAVFFGFQIYGDFSGYSDIAIGTSKLFGIELMSNFKFPYFSRNIAEFWRRWHISLSTWFRDYIYIPLGGSRSKMKTVIRNILLVFIISGFWHGANWTFIVWGGIHALLFIPLLIRGQNRKYLESFVWKGFHKSVFRQILGILTTFVLVTLSWVFFRAESLAQAVVYFKRMFFNMSFQFYSHPQGYRLIDYFILLALFVLYEYIIRKDERNPYKFKSKSIRFVLYTLTIFGIILFYDSGIDRSFIYFQF
ncbi:MBOAT family O-acyltransferase [Flagellimonas sp. S174]|uniref:MBOAT family O-acyltransferase n=1 Tax=Flagellimonas sp. S174 TaxID=3410790 RepID=UPI003BF556AC